jgi:hypothetical protein
MLIGHCKRFPSEPSTVDAPRQNRSQWPTGEVLPSESSSANKAK